MDGPERLEFVRSRLKNSGLVLLAVLMVLMCYSVAASADNFFESGVGWFGVAFFGLAGLVGLARTARGGVVFSFDANGVTDHSNSLVIPWREIQECDVVSVQGASFLAISLRDPDQFLSRVSLIKRAISRLDAFMDCGDWALSFSGVSPDIQAALSFIRKHAPSVRAPRR
jgi:hypothetical protein